MQTDRNIPNYKRTYYITSKALDALKDEDEEVIDARILMNEIDQAIREAIHDGKEESIWDMDEAGRLIRLDNWFDDSVMFVLLKQDRTHLAGWAAVTALPENIVNANRLGGHWTWCSTPHPEVLDNKYYRKIVGVSKRATKAETRDINYLILFYKTKDNTEHYERIDMERAGSRISEITKLPNYDGKSIETYGKIKDVLISNSRLEF